LHPDTPLEGQSLEALFEARNLNAEAIHLNMKAVMDEAGLPYGQRSHTYNSRLAQELAKWAETQEPIPQKGAALHDLLYAAYFVQGEDISNRDVLLRLASDAGLDVAAAEVVLDERTFSPAIDADWELSRTYGVTGVPTYVADGRGVVGAQELDVLIRLVEAGGAQAVS
jgi:predicted DsbA family dithiol-disulfide isomerase